MSQTQKERMLAGLPYRANDPELKQIRAENKLRVARYNQLTRNQEQELTSLIKEILGGTGEHILVEPPIHFDYGRNTYVGENFLPTTTSRCWTSAKSPSGTT